MVVIESNFQNVPVVNSRKIGPLNSVTGGFPVTN